MINKNTQNTNLSWNPNWVNHQYFLLLQNYIYKYFFPTTIDKDGTTPYLPVTTGRMIQPPILSVVSERMLWHLVYQLPLEGGYDPLIGMLLALAPPSLPYMIIWSLTYVHLWIIKLNVKRCLFEILKPCLYTLKRISSSNSHVSSSWLFTNKNQFEIASLF